MKDLSIHAKQATDLLCELIAIPRVSREETAACDHLEQAMVKSGLKPHREGNNLWVISNDYTPTRPTLLLNAHIDTVRPVASWSRDPFSPVIEGDKLYGLGSNDCGGGLVSLLEVFKILSNKPQSYNLVYLASAEEEVSGKNGISSVLPLLPPISVALVGEPTGMEPAIAEKGLMVIDMTSHGQSGHAARNEGINAIYKMLDDLVWLRDYRFDKTSPFLGPTLMSVTVINAGTQHNVTPDICKAIIDVRTNELYDNEEVFNIIQNNVKSEVKARSFRLKSSHIETSHPIVEQCIRMGKKAFGSPTLSDQALMPFPSLKMGPGQSSRSHSADEYICLSEIKKAIEEYISILDGLTLP